MGIAFASNELTLVLFTTLAPSGAVAVGIMALVLLFGSVSPDERHRLDKWLCIPLVATMAGLVASATHLGNPANALYTFLGVGRSPLSNEVCSAVAFLGTCGVYWLCSFRLRQNLTVQRIWLAAIIVLGALFLCMVSLAYNADTIITWHTPFVPLALMANALVGGPVLAAATLRIAQWPASEGGALRLWRVLAGVSASGIAGSLVLYALHGLELAGLQNHVVSAAELVPAYWPMLLCYGVLCAAGAAASLHAGRVGCAAHARAWDALALACTFAGIFIMRFAFYMMHLTPGLA